MHEKLQSWTRCEPGVLLCFLADMQKNLPRLSLCTKGSVTPVRQRTLLLSNDKAGFHAVCHVYQIWVNRKSGLQTRLNFHVGSKRKLASCWEFQETLFSRRLWRRCVCDLRSFTPDGGTDAVASFSKDVRSFCDVHHSPDQWHRYHLHWLRVQNFCVTYLINWGTARKEKLAVAESRQ